VVFIADALIEACVEKDYDLVVLPGGMPGAEHLRDSTELTHILKRQLQKKGLYGAICASPAVVLAHHGLLEGRQATCHPSFVDRLTAKDRVDDRVVADANCLTSKGPGTAIEFALALVERLYGKDKRAEVAAPMVI
jgi:4-methyl-5(b-hydroxyethyl)-thiazole monophosphate biosynthesis